MAVCAAGYRGWPFLLRSPVSLLFTPIWSEGDQANFLDHAKRMVEGQVIYRDLFQFNLPGLEYLYYGLFRCFGFRLWIAPLALCVTETATVLTVFSLSPLAIRGAGALLPAVVLFGVSQLNGLDGTHQWYSTLLVLVSINIVARTNKLVPIGIAGVLLAFATIFTSSRGLFIAAAVCLFFT
jgi:hypothetical protein